MSYEDTIIGGAFKLLIDDTDQFFAYQWQQQADDIAREPVQTPQLEEMRARAQEKADFYREKILSTRGPL